MSHTRYEVVFTGDEASYRPIWRKTMLLLLLSAGFAFPWAIVASKRYFYQNTHVAGGHLDFHANPGKMFASNVLGTLLINAIYFGIAQTGPYKLMGVAIMQILTAALLPMFLHGFLRFQIMHTSWRGQRLKLAATPADAFRAMGSSTLLYIVGGVLAVWAVIAGMGGERGLCYGLGTSGAILLAISVPWFYVQFKAYQYRYTVIGDWPDVRQQVLKPGESMRVSLRTGALFLLGLAAVILPLTWGLSELVGLDWETVARLKQNEGHAESVRLALVLVPGIFLGLMMIMGLPFAYVSVQLQNRLLHDTAHLPLRVESDVPEREWLMLTMRNWFLVTCTLGWYYPRAAITETRLRLRSVSVWVKSELVADESRAST